MVLSNSFQASLYPTIYIVWIKGQPKVENLPIVADCRPSGETLFPSPTDDPPPTMVSERSFYEVG
jgi:hypothetical protein